jgi:hypothetical protein
MRAQSGNRQPGFPKPPLDWRELRQQEHEQLVPLEFSTTTVHFSKLVYVESVCRVLTASPPMAPWLRLGPAEMALVFTGPNTRWMVHTMLAVGRP